MTIIGRIGIALMLTVTLTAALIAAQAAGASEVFLVLGTILFTVGAMMLVGDVEP